MRQRKSCSDWWKEGHVTNRPQGLHVKEKKKFWQVQDHKVRITRCRSLPATSVAAARRMALQHGFGAGRFWTGICLLVLCLGHVIALDITELSLDPANGVEQEDELG